MTDPTGTVPPQNVSTRRARQIASEIVWNGPDRPPAFLFPDATIRLGDLFRVVRIETDEDGATYTLEHQPRSEEAIS